MTGKYVIPLQNTTQQPLLTSLENRGVREKLFNQSWTRAEKGDRNDTRAIISRLAVLRADKAKLLGYPNYAAYVLYDQMAQTPDAVEKFIGQLVPPTRAKAAEEARLIQQAIDKDGPHFDLKPWDWQRYSEKVRKARYDLDEAALKPYFELNKVLKDGVFYAANKLYGITFKQRHDIPVYQPDVMVFEVFDQDGKTSGPDVFRLFQARQQIRRRLDEQFRRPVETAGHQARDLQCRQLHQAGARPARADQLRRCQHHVP